MLWLAWASLLVLVPLTTRLPSSGLLNSGRFAGYLWTDFLFALVLFAKVVSKPSPKGKSLPNNYAGHTIEIILLLLILAQYLSVLVSIFRGDEMRWSYLWGAGSIWIKSLAAFAIGKSMVRDERDLQSMWRFFLVGYVIVCAISLLEVAGNETITDFLNANYGTELHVEAALHRAQTGQYSRVTATFDRNPHGLAVYMMMGITGIVSVLVTIKSIKGRSRLCLLFLLGVGIVVLLGTLSKLGVLAALTSLATVLIPWRTRIRRRWQIASLLVIILVSLAATSFLQNPIVRIVNMFVAAASDDFSSPYLGNFTERLEAWRAITSIILASPSDAAIGVGPSRLVRLYIYANSDYMFVLFTTGIMGLACFLLLLRFAFAGIQQRLQDCSNASGYWTALLVAARGILCGFAVAGFAGPFLASEAFGRTKLMLWTLLGVALSFSAARGNFENLHGDSQHNIARP